MSYNVTLSFFCKKNCIFIYFCKFYVASCEKQNLEFPVEYVPLDRFYIWAGNSRDFS